MRLPLPSEWIHAFYDELTDGTHACDLSFVVKEHNRYSEFLDKRSRKILHMVPKDQRKKAEKMLNEISFLTNQIYWLEILMDQEYPESSDQEIVQLMEEEYPESGDQEVAEDAINFDDDDILRELDSM